jgi:hypothetical protein
MIQTSRISYKPYFRIGMFMKQILLYGIIQRLNSARPCSNFAYEADSVF